MPKGTDPPELNRAVKPGKSKKDDKGKGDKQKSSDKKAKK